MFGFFKKKRTMLDEVNEATVKMFRPFIQVKMSDELILEIIQKVMTSFKEAASSKGERLSGSVLLNIAAHFVALYGTVDSKFYSDHLIYELDKYKREGLRDSYSQGPF